MFRSSAFPIENRPGLEDASAPTLFRHLLQYGDILALRDSPKSAEVASKRELYIRTLSDWHLISFISTLGLLSEVGLSTEC
jgi:nuclear protein localization protein 4 homolog